MGDGEFVDRADAGRRLGVVLAGLELDKPVVVGIARGGLIVAAEVATRLEADLAVSVARKVGAPGNPELAIGAVTPDGTVVLDEGLAAATGATEDYLRREIASEVAEARRRLEAFGGGDTAVGGRDVVLVDDGIATGATAKAALRALRRAGAKRIVLAVPCAPPSTLDELRPEADRIVALIIDAGLMATGQYYRDFRPVGDEQVRAALAAGVTRRAPAGP